MSDERTIHWNQKVLEFQRDMMEFFQPVWCSYSIDISCWFTKLLRDDGLGAAIDLDIYAINFLADVSGQKVRRAWHATPEQINDASVFKFYHRCKMDLAMALPEYFESGYEAEVFKLYDFDIPDSPDEKKEEEMPDLRKDEVSMVKKRVFGLLKEVSEELQKLPEEELEKMGEQFSEAIVNRIKEVSSEEKIREKKEAGAEILESKARVLRQQQDLSGMPGAAID